MTEGTAFWIIMLVSLLFGGGWYVAPERFGAYGWAGGLIIFILIALLGIHDFGWPIHGG